MATRGESQRSVATRAFNSEWRPWNIFGRAGRMDKALELENSEFKMEE
jgi:hypothetical protein